MMDYQILEKNYFISLRSVAGQGKNETGLLSFFFESRTRGLSQVPEIQLTKNNLVNGILDFYEAYRNCVLKSKCEGQITHWK